MSQTPQSLVPKLNEDAIENALDEIPIAIHSQQWKKAIESLGTISTQLNRAQKEKTTMLGDWTSLVNLTDKIRNLLIGINIEIALPEVMADQEKELARLCFNAGNNDEGMNHINCAANHLDNIGWVKVNDIFPCLRQFLLIWYKIRSPQPLSYNFIQLIKDETKKMNAAKIYTQKL
jgi:hypothetical protein